MAYYTLGDTFRWFMGRVVELDPTEDPQDKRYLGRVKVRVIHDQTVSWEKRKAHTVSLTVICCGRGRSRLFSPLH